MNPLLSHGNVNRYTADRRFVEIENRNSLYYCLRIFIGSSIDNYIEI
jgi:hypothetical protein